MIGYGDGGLAVINAQTHDKVAEIPLPAHPEGLQLVPQPDGYLSMSPRVERLRSPTLRGHADSKLANSAASQQLSDGDQ